MFFPLSADAIRLLWMTAGAQPGSLELDTAGVAANRFPAGNGAGKIGKP
jgi:hypothetical protein